MILLYVICMQVSVEPMWLSINMVRIQGTGLQQALIGLGGYFPEDVRDVLNIMESEKWDIGSIITHVYPWEKLPDAIEKAGQVNEALNVVIEY